MKVAAIVCALSAASHASAFAPLPTSASSIRVPSSASTTAARASNKNGGGPFGGVAEFFQNLDDIVDDFYNKRMGKGEIFYGKRKYRPSGDVEGDYNGFGLSDKQRINDTREYREARLEERRIREEMAELRRRKDQQWRDEYGE